MNEEVAYDPGATARPAWARRVAWQSVLAGAVVALAAELLLSVLGLSVGATIINPNSASQNTAQNIGIGEAAWMIITTIVSLYLGGWVAGRMSGLTRGAEGALHGLVTWGVATLAAAFVLGSSVSAVLSGTMGLMRTAAPAASQAFSQSGQGGGTSSALEGALTGQGGSSTPQEALNAAKNNPQMASAIAKLMEEAPNVQPQDREAVVNMLVSQKNETQQQASQTVDRWIQSAAQAKTNLEQGTRQVGSAAATGVSAVGWWTFIILVLSMIAALWGGSSGASSFLKSRGGPEIRPAAPATR